MNTAKLSLISGATGLLGSHIAEQLRERGERVRGSSGQAATRRR